MNKIQIIFLFALVSISMLHAGYSQTQNKYSAKLENGIWYTIVNKQVQITTDLTNNQDRTQPFAYIVQVQNQEGVVVSLSWITGTLDAGQSLSPGQSWIPYVSGVYTAQIFVWAGIDNPDALSPPISLNIHVT